MSEMVDTSMQNVGIREDKEKKTYKPYTSRERRYERNNMSTWEGWGWAVTHDEDLQVNPIITDQKPHVTSEPETT